MGLPDELTGTSLRVAPERFPDPTVDVPAQPGVAQTAVLAGGCFWCVEAVYRALEGVTDVIPGYAGSTAETADYETVCTGRTAHAEVVQVTFDPTKTTFGQVLKVFFSIAHDPTQLNRQGADVGRQYRSAIFYADEPQKRAAEEYIKQLNAAGVFRSPVVTEVVPLEKFYEAEQYHHDYAAQHPNQPYVAYTALPKVYKLKKHFADRVRKD